MKEIVLLEFGVITEDEYTLLLQRLALHQRNAQCVKVLVSKSGLVFSEPRGREPRRIDEIRVEVKNGLGTGSGADRRQTAELLTSLPVFSTARWSWYEYELEQAIKTHYAVEFLNSDDSVVATPQRARVSLDKWDGSPTLNLV